MKELKKIQALYFIASAVASLTFYVHSNFASSVRVENLEEQIRTIRNIICSIAIDQNLTRSQEICRRDK